MQNFYSTLDDGINAVKRGDVLGTVYLASNFSASIEERQTLGRDTSDGSIENSIAYYWLDMSSKILFHKGNKNANTQFTNPFHLQIINLLISSNKCYTEIM